MKILVVDDDKNTAEMIRNDLASTQNIVEVAEEGATGAFMGRSFDYDAIILDYSMPKKDGITVLKEIRQSGRQTPVIFLSVNSNEDLKVQALENGADDYLTKPFALKELKARLNAISRRPRLVREKILALEDLTLDPEKHIVTRNTKEIQMTRKEFGLLEYLMRNQGTVLSRATLLEHVWTADSNPFSNTVETHIRNLRKKICIDEGPNLIANIPGRGYLIDTAKG